jgi:hypothetical protein
MAKSLSAMFDELPVRGEECLGCPAGTRDALALIVPRGQWPPSIKQGFLQMVDPVHNIKKRFVSFHKWDEGLIASPIASLLHGSPLQKSRSIGYGKPRLSGVQHEAALNNFDVTLDRRVVRLRAVASEEDKVTESLRVMENSAVQALRLSNGMSRYPE